MVAIEITDIHEYQDGLTVDVHTSGPEQWDYEVSLTGDVEGHSEVGSHPGWLGDKGKSYQFDLEGESLSQGDEILVTAITLGDITEQQQEYHTVSSDLEQVGGGGGGSGGSGSTSVSLDDYSVEEDGDIRVEWSATSSEYGYLSGFIGANVQGVGYYESTIGANFNSDGTDSGASYITPNWGPGGSTDVTVEVVLEDGDVSETDYTTFTVDVPEGNQRELEVKHIEYIDGGVTVGDTVDLTVWYGTINDSGLYYEWEGDLVLMNGNNVIAEQRVEAIDDRKEHTFSVNIANSGSLELCAEIINQGEI